MAFYRTALRLATIEALRPTALLGATNAAWPTLACDRVFDSRIDPLEDLTQEKAKAVIAVYTEGDQGYAGQKRGGPPFRREVELIFEISHIALAPGLGDPAVFEPAIPMTDSELEGALDRLETEIAFALFYAPGGLLWRQLTGSMVTDPRSTPHRDSEEGRRLAMRSICWKVQAPDDDFIAAPSSIPQALDRLPEPMRSVAKQLSARGYGAQIAAGLAATMPTMPVPTPLADVTLGVEIVKPGKTQTGEANINGAAEPLAGYPGQDPTTWAGDNPTNQDET